MKGADAVICAIGSSGFNPKGPKTVDYEVCQHPFIAAVIVCLLCLLTPWLPCVHQPQPLCAELWCQAMLSAYMYAVKTITCEYIAIV